MGDEACPGCDVTSQRDRTARPRAPGRPAPWTSPARLPVRPGTGRFLVLACVFVCAACGLVYELELVAFASYLIGDSVTQASVVLSVMVFAMGIGSLGAKRLRCHAAAGFVAVEAVLALVGGCSAMALYAVFAWTAGWGGVWAAGPRCLLVAFSLAIGLLIGAEVPLLMELIQRVRRQDAGGAVADLFAADYVGALVGGLAFPFLLLPFLGQLTGALLTGTVNVVAGGALVLGLFRRDLGPRARRLLLCTGLVVLGVLAGAAALAGDFERAARHAVYGGDVRVAVRTGVQEIVLAGGTRGRPLDLFLDGRLRVGGRDERRYHEALVHPALTGPHARVLILGGGDGLAAREVLRHRDVHRLDLVEPDPGLVELARHDPGLAAANAHAFADPRLHVTTADALTWLRGRAGGRTTSWSPTCPTPASPPAPSCTPRSSTAWPAGCWPRGAAWWCTPVPSPPGRAPTGPSPRPSARPASACPRTGCRVTTAASRPAPTARRARPGPRTTGASCWRPRAAPRRP